MKHGNNNRTLGRPRRQRTALMRGLAISLIRDGQIKTTLAKAKELRPFAERLVTYGKTGTVAARRQAASALGEPKSTTITKLFSEIAPKFEGRDGATPASSRWSYQRRSRRAVIEYVE